MSRSLTVLLATLLLTFAFSSAALTAPASNAPQQKVFGWLLRQGNVLVLQSDGGDYLVAGGDLSRLEGRMVEITGTVSQNDRGGTIYVKSAREVDE